MKFTDEQVKLIKDFARKELQYNTHDPVEATLRGLYMMMSREGMHISIAPQKNSPEPMGGIESEAGARNKADKD